MSAMPPSRKFILDKLGQLSKQDAQHEHFLEFQAEVSNEQSHRGAVILLVTNVENALEAAIVALLIYNRRNAVLGGPGQALNGFSSKIGIGYAMNIYGDETYRNLDTMRRVRNAFAHAKVPINFMTKEVMDACNTMIIPTVRAPHVMGANDEPTDHLAGLARFRKICERLSHNLIVSTLFGSAIKIDVAALRVPIEPEYTELVARYGPLP